MSEQYTSNLNFINAYIVAPGAHARTSRKKKKNERNDINVFARSGKEMLYNRVSSKINQTQALTNPDLAMKAGETMTLE